MIFAVPLLYGELHSLTLLVLGKRFLTSDVEKMTERK